MPYSTSERVPETSKYYHTGIGGIGNYRKKSTTSSTLLSSPPSSLPPTPTDAPSIPRSSFRPFHGGRGGAGNTYGAPERAMFSFDEELAQERRAPVYSIGRGGVGNIVNEDDENSENEHEPASLEEKLMADNYNRMRRMSSKSTTSSDSNRSTRSTESGADRLMHKLKSLTKH